jgi:O-antigen ligase
VIALLVLPGALTAYLAFNLGGYHPGATSVAALVLGLVLLLRIIIAADPFEGLTLPLAVAAMALMLLGAWALISSSWSDSPARALIELNRVLLYLFAMILFGSFLSHPYRIRRIAWGLTAAIVGVCAVGLATRTFPDVFEIAPAVQKERLSHPIGYWNALGLLASLGIVLCVHLTSSEREPPLARVLGAAALPMLAATLLFTYARGPLLAVAVGVVAYVLLARPRSLLTGAIAAVPPTIVALLSAYDADLLASKEPTTSAAAAQGHDVALVVVVTALLAAGLRLVLLWLDTRLARLALPPERKRPLALGGVAAALAAAVLVLTATDATDRVEAQYKRFTRSDLGQTGDYRERLTNPGINRLDHWEVALEAFNEDRLRGQGAGTYSLFWEQNRPTKSDAEEAHSLYLETMGELGVVGTVLLSVALLALLVGVARRARGPERAVYAVVLATSLAWLLHAGIDWDWELPVITLWLFVLAAAAAAAPADGTRVPRPPRLAVRAAAALACVAVAVTPVLMATSQARLNESLRAFHRGDCRTAMDEASAATSLLGSRPQPYQLLGYCASRLGQLDRAERMMREAVEHDPRNWEYHYGLALVRASAGRDPLAAARQAIRLNPNETVARQAMARFGVAGGPDQWRRAARDLPTLVR